MQYIIKPAYNDYYGLIDYLKCLAYDVQHYYGDIVVTTPDNFHEVRTAVKRYVKNVAIVRQIGTDYVRAVTPQTWYRVTVHAQDTNDMMLVRDLFVTHKPMCDSNSMEVTFYQTSADGKRIAQYIAERTGYSDRKISVVPVYYGDTRRRNVYRVYVSDSQYQAVAAIASFMDVYGEPQIKGNEITFTANMKVTSMRRILRNIGELSFVVNGKKTYKTR
jgi:hypothetical protein